MSEQEEHEVLKRKYAKLEREFDVQCQELYDCRRNEKLVAAVHDEYHEEIKALQMEHNAEKNILETKIQHLESTISTLKTAHNEEVHSFEKDVSCKDAKIKELKRELEDVIKISGIEDVETDVKLLDELCDMKQKISELTELVEKLEEAWKTSEKLSQDKIKQLEEDLESYKENLQCKRDALEEANTLIQSLIDDYVCVKTELDRISSEPRDDQSRGNSLFAEVDDRRLQLQQNMKLMKTRYAEMKHEHALNLKKISLLRSEKTTLLARWKSETEEKELDQEMIKHSRQEQVKMLKELIESYKKDLKQITDTLNSTDGAKYLDGLLAFKSAEIEDLRQKLSARSFNYNSLSCELAESHTQLRKYNLEVSQLKNEIGLLKLKIEELNLRSPPVKVVEDVKKNDTSEAQLQVTKPIIKPICQKEKSEPEAALSENKENGESSKRKVKFTGETKQDDGNVSKMRRCKVLVEKPRQYF